MHATLLDEFMDVVQKERAKYQASILHQTGDGQTCEAAVQTLRDEWERRRSGVGTDWEVGIKQWRGGGLADQCQTTNEIFVALRFVVWNLEEVPTS